ncbi:MAG TPA: AraC family transcriptional regulator [Steroidobacteraceae bacterium]|nr:AraC family transcriptional regulator [Steroidobacteraceae bacterium]
MKESGRRQSGVAGADPFRAAVIEAIASLLPAGRPTLKAVAEVLALSPRTLQRRLDTHGHAFRDLLAECLYRRACEELLAGERSVREVGAGLGYNDPAHFARAFRRWAGQPPSDFLRNVTSSSRDQAPGRGK